MKNKNHFSSTVLPRLRSELFAAIGEAEAAAAALRQAQRTTDVEVSVALKFEIAAMRRELGERESAQRSDLDLQPTAKRRLSARLVKDATSRFATAKAAAAAARERLASARTDAQRLTLPTPGLTSDERIAAGVQASTVQALREITQLLKLQSVERRVSKVTDPEKLLALLREAEAREDVLTAIAAEEQLRDALAAGPRLTGTEDAHGITKAQKRHEALAGQLDAHCASRVDEETAAALTEHQAAIDAVEKDLAAASTLQLAIEQTGQILVEETTPAPAA